MQVYQCYCKPITRIIRTDASIQPYNYDNQEIEKDQQSFYLQDSFLKENFNIVDARYFKLVILPSECNNLDHFLWTNEFKKVLARSPFLYDVNVVEGSRGLSEISSVDFCAYEGALFNYEDSAVNKQPINEFDVLFSSNSDKKERVLDKPSEEQLLHVIDRLSYSVSI